MWNKLSIFVKMFWLQHLCQKDFCAKIFAKYVLRKFLQKYVQDRGANARGSMKKLAVIANFIILMLVHMWTIFAKTNFLVKILEIYRKL